MPKLEPGFRLRYDRNGSSKYPYGYWYAVTNDGNWDADGDSPLNAISNLLIEVHEELMTINESRK